MTAHERRELERLARTAISRLLNCDAISDRLEIGEGGPTHQFDIYARGVVIGGVTTGTYKTSGGKSNTGACDRAFAELLWLSLWPGNELRVHVLTDKPLADWLIKRLFSAPFPKRIDIYHYDQAPDLVTYVGTIGAQ